MTNFVLVVPKQTLNNLLVFWLCLTDVGKLDAALCDCACRDVFEYSLALRNFGGNTDALCANSKFISWVIKRKIKLDMLHIESSLLRPKNEKLRCKLLAVVGPTLRRAVIDCGKDTQFNSKYFAEYLDSDSDCDSDSVGDTKFDDDSSCDCDILVETKIVDEVIIDLSMKCTKLETFTVLGHHSSSVMSLLQMNPKLCSVTLRNCPKVLRCIAALCPYISSITITEQAASIDLKEFAAHVPLKLTQLCLSHSEVKRSFLMPVLERASLRELRLGCVPFDLSTLATSCPNLEIFSCMLEYGVYPEDFVAQLSPFAPNLRTLILDKPTAFLSNAVLAKILESFPRLRQFCADPKFEDKLSELPLSAGLAPPGHTAAWGPVLEELYVGNPCEYNQQQFHLEEVLQSCPALHSIGLSYASWNGSKFQQCAAAGIVKIVCLNMGYAYCSNYTQLSGLQELEMTGCKHLENRALRRIARNCPQLTRLHVHDAPMVTLPAVLEVLKRCPQLRSLECVYQNEKEERSTEAKMREQSATVAVTEMCKLQYPRLQHLRLRFV